MSDTENTLLNINDQIVRENYNNQLFELFKTQYAKQAFEIHNNEECIAAALAREASGLRSAIKTSKQEETSYINQVFIYVRNWWFYGDAKGPSFESLMTKKTSEEVFYSSFKSGGKDMGLESNEMSKYINLTKEARTNNPDFDLHPEHFLFYEIRQNDTEWLMNILGKEYHQLFEQYIPALEEEILQECLVGRDSDL